MLAPWKKRYDKSRQCVKKQRHHFASKGLSSQSYDFSNSHVWMGLPGGTSGKKKKTRLLMQETQETWVQSVGWEDPLEKGIATYSSILAWRIPGREGPDGL